MAAPQLLQDHEVPRMEATAAFFSAEEMEAHITSTITAADMAAALGAFPSTAGTATGDHALIQSLNPFPRARQTFGSGEDVQNESEKSEMRKRKR